MDPNSFDLLLYDEEDVSVSVLEQVVKSAARMLPLLIQLLWCTLTLHNVGVFARDPHSLRF
jgi:hypothetical protein